MVVNEKPLTKRVVDLDVNFVNDEELQAALAKQRCTKMKERCALKPEDIARKGKSC
jgi:U4/U6.U5 tri-snRNP-associated protein 1